MRCWKLTVVTILLIGSTASIGGPLPTVGTAVASTGAIPTSADVFEAANGTGFAHPALGVQGGAPQLLVLLFSVELPAVNAKDASTAPGANRPAAATPDRSASLTDLWSARELIEKAVGGSRDNGESSGTSASLARVDARLLVEERARLDSNLQALDSNQPGSDAYQKALQDLIAQRSRLSTLLGSQTEGGDGARTELSRLNERLLTALPDRAAGLRTTLNDENATAADRMNAAKELREIYTALRDTPGTDGVEAGAIRNDLAEYYEQREEALTTILNDGDVDAQDATALKEARQVREELLALGAREFVGRPEDPLVVTLGAIEELLVDNVSNRVKEHAAVLGDDTKSARDKKEALASLIRLWDELQLYTYGQTSRRNASDPSHDQLITNLGAIIDEEITKRHSEIGSTIDNLTADDPLGAAINELFEDWRTLRRVGKNDTANDVEQTIQTAAFREADRLRGDLEDDDPAKRAAAAKALLKLRSQLHALAEAWAEGESRYENTTYDQITEWLRRYGGGRLGELETVLDNASSTPAQKTAALAELRQLRDMLVGIGLRAPAVGARGGDFEITTIDRRLRAAGVLRVDEVERILRSNTATVQQKRAALIELESLGDLLEDNNEVFERIEQLQKLGLDSDLRRIEGDLNDAPPPSATTPNTPVTRSADASRINLLENPEALASSIADLANFALPGGPPLAALGFSTGNSQGLDAMNWMFANAGGAADVFGEGLIVEPVTTDPEIINALWRDVMERANAVVSVSPEGYCLEKEQRPPAPSEIYMIASAGKQSLFSPARSILTTSEDLFVAGQLHPEESSNPVQYFHSIRQWAIWTEERDYDEQSFTDDWIDQTRDSLEKRGFQWTDDIEQELRRSAPNRWRDISNIMTAAGLAG